MVGAPTFSSWNEMENSAWVESLRTQMNRGQWPLECRRCQQTEESANQSIRLNSIERDKLLSAINKDYLILGGVLDNICNSACQTCNAKLSTKIGSLYTNDYIKVDNSELFKQVPRERIVELDLNGGEPTASPEYQRILNNLPEHIKILRVNTNGSRVLPNIESILERKIQVIITLSLDGVDAVHDYVRWPVKWSKYTQTVERYKQLKAEYKNLKLEAWTTISALNARDFDNIVEYANTSGLAHSWAFLNTPEQLDPRQINYLTLHARETISNLNVKKQLATQSYNQAELDEYIIIQDRLRNIDIKDYL